jgi:hypothetical protein
MSDAVRDAVVFKTGAAVGVPASGTKALFVDTDGGLKIIDSSGNKTNAGSSSWYATQQTFLQAAIPQLTAFELYKFGTVTGGQAVAMQAGLADGATEGGSIAATNSAGLKVQSASSFQTMKTGAWGFAMRIKLAAIAVGEFSEIGFGNAAFSHFILFATVQAESATKFVMRFVGGATTITPTTQNADTNWHTIAMTSDGTTISAYLDGALACSSAVVTNITDEPMFFAMVASAAGTVKCSRLITGVIDP